MLKMLDEFMQHVLDNTTKGWWIDCYGPQYFNP
jgi:hypothetical protein